ncbi:MAG: hypothetical protein ACK4HW_04725 [Roseinatronobacter sp.]
MALIGSGFLSARALRFLQGGVSALALVTPASLTYLAGQGGNSDHRKGFQMASITTNTAPRTNVLARLGASLLHTLVRVAEANPKYQQAQRLAAMTDAELAKLGMTRADIPQRVWGSRFI